MQFDIGLFAEFGRAWPLAHYIDLSKYYCIGLFMDDVNSRHEHMLVTWHLAIWL